MLCEHLIHTRNEALGLSVTVRVMSLDSPRSEDQLKSALLAHVLDCHDCLTVVLFEEESLDKAGCAEYRKLFAEATEELSSQTTLDPEEHLTERMIEAFSLDKLSDEQLRAMAEHVEHCTSCRAMLNQRESLRSSIRDALRNQQNSRAGFTGILGLHVPDENWHMVSRLGD